MLSVFVKLLKRESKGYLKMNYKTCSKQLIYHTIIYMKKIFNLFSVQTIIMDATQSYTECQDLLCMDYHKWFKVIYGYLYATFLSFGIFPWASSFARACLRFRIRWYCLAFTYRGSSSWTSVIGNWQGTGWRFSPFKTC